MSISAPRTNASGHGDVTESSYFVRQREVLVGEIAVVSSRHGVTISGHSANPSRQSLEQVLQNMNKLNRSLEGVIAVSSHLRSNLSSHNESLGWE